MKTKILKHRVPKRILIGMLLVLFCFTSKAQTWENVHFNVDWQMNVPLNSNFAIISVCFLSLFPYHVYFEVYKSSTHPLADKFGIALYKTDDAVVVFGIGIAYTSALYHLECCQ